MNNRPEVEFVLRRWFEEGPSTMPDRVVDVVADRISRQRQRRAWRLHGRLFMNGYLKLAAGLAAALVIAVIGWNLLPRGQSGVGGPAPTPTVAPTPSPSPILLTAPTGALAPGTYAVSVGAGRVAFTVPAGWAAPQVGQGSSDFTLHLNNGPAADTVQVFFDMRRAAKDAACTEGPAPAIGATAQALVADFQADNNLHVTTTKPLQLGDLQGFAIDVSLAPTTTRTCPFSSGAPTVPLVVDTLAGTGPYWGIGAGEQIRLVILDAPGVTNIVVVIDSAAGLSFRQLVGATMPVVQTLVFSPT